MVDPDYMLSEILDQPNIMKTILSNLDILETVNKIKEMRIKRIYLIGCGDSYCAAWFGSYYAKSLCPEFQVQHYEPFEFVNYSLIQDFNQSLVIGISVSGGTLRILEALRFSRLKGAFTMIITDNPNGKAVKEADLVALIQASPPETLLSTSYESDIAKQYTGYQNDVAQTKTYFANLVVLCQIISYLTLEPQKYLNHLHSTINLVKQAIEQFSKIRSLTNTLQNNTDHVIFVASGSNSPTALFGAYKMFEFTLNGFSCDIEEYCHTRYFITTDKSTVIFLAPDSASFNRVMEIEPIVRKVIKAKTLIITNNTFSKDEKPNILSFNLPDENYLSPLVFTIPIEQLSYSIAKVKGFNTNTFRGGVETEKYVTGSFETIRNTKLKY
ncbi:MAG: SIS domain-containing protein [Candidatus Hodarchaeales archaeon]|jgi:glucosamine--fructose-6-phosphate aminotransferase (isomerizing)